jgi:hypothetical protein
MMAPLITTDRYWRDPIVSSKRNAKQKIKQEE